MIRFIATKLRSADNPSGVSRPAIVVATAGVAVGLIVMMLTVCVAIGFKQEIHDIVRRTGGDFHVLNVSTIDDEGDKSLVVNDSVLAALRDFPGVSDAFRVSTTLGCLKTDSGFLGMQLVGADSDSSVSQLLASDYRLQKDDIVVSAEQAARLNLCEGDKVMAYFFNNGVRARRFTVAGVYSTNISDFDRTQVFTSYSTVCELSAATAGECDYVQLFVEDGYAGMVPDNITSDDAELNYQLSLLQFLRTLIPVTPDCQPSIVTMQNLHPQIFSWLDLLDINVWVIIALMLCVAGFTMASGLLILILERTQMIGLLKAIGARFATLRGIFIYIAMDILLRGMAIGNVIALAMAYAQKCFHVVRLNPVDYYVDAVPIAIPFPELVALNVGTVVLTLLLLIIPTYIIAHISPVKAMKFE